MVCKLCAYIPLVTYCIKCRINCFKCRLLVVMHGPPTAMKYVGPASFRSFAHTHIHTMIRPVIPLTGVNIKLICNNMDALVSFDKMNIWWKYMHKRGHNDSHINYWYISFPYFLEQQFFKIRFLISFHNLQKCYFWSTCSFYT